MLRRMLRRVRISALAALTVLALLSPAAGARSGARRAPVLGPGSTYLALGDSVTFGYMESTVVPAPRYRDAASFLGYPEHLARELRIRVVNAACSGETSASLINSRAQSNGCENSLGSRVGYRTRYPLHVRYRGSQLRFAVRYLLRHPDVRLVSLMIGANDVFLCQKTTKDGCLAPAEERAVFAKISGNVHRILTAIRRQAHYRGQLVIVNYYSLNYASALFSGVSRGINQAMDRAARPFGVAIADGYGEFQAQALRFGQSPCQAGLLTQWMQNGTPTCGVHPSYAGQALLAEAVLKAIRL